MSSASAGETALLAREALRVAAYGAETREYLHGPLEAVGDGFACVLFGGARELELAGELASYGALVCAIAAHPVPGGSGVHCFALPALIEPARVVLEIVPVQLLVLHAAAARGLTVQALRRQQRDTKVTAG
jgi:glucosamine--fructose-6-phosphate aminotransferase (isomerizing)